MKNINFQSGSLLARNNFKFKENEKMDKIRLEYPKVSTKITDLFFIFRGWCTSDTDSRDVRLFVNTNKVDHNIIARPDVMRVFPDKNGFGFSYFVDLRGYDFDEEEYKIKFRVSFGSARDVEVFCEIDERVSQMARDYVHIQDRKRKWCLEHLQCPVCRSPRTQEKEQFNVDENAVTCCSCGSVFPNAENALNLITPALYGEFNLKPTSNVSANRYSDFAKEIVEGVREKGGKVLDCGAGMRLIEDETIINLEIVDYSSTDILAVGQSLPFKDASFDAVVSLAVLEHVSDPFKCADEIVRVVKPGGTVLCVVPFLQKEHGYPNHYYNMTRQGLQNLFKDKMEIIKQFVPDSGHPIRAIRSILAVFEQNLEGEIKEKFLEMKTRDFLDLRIENIDDEEIVKNLSDEGRWAIASTTAIIMKKPL